MFGEDFNEISSQKDVNNELVAYIMKDIKKYVGSTNIFQNGRPNRSGNNIVESFRCEPMFRSRDKMDVIYSE